MEDYGGRQCPICGSKHVECIDPIDEKEAILRCQDCRHEWTGKTYMGV
jgi:transposase-like protein